MYKNGRDCRVGLLIPDTPVSAMLVLQSCKSMWTKFFYHTKPVVSCHHAGKVYCVHCTM